MSVLDTLGRLEKRAAGQQPEAKHSVEELKLLAVEMQKQALVGRLLQAATVDVPHMVGKGVGHLLSPLGWAAKQTAKGGLNLGARLVSETAALPFDHPGKLLTTAMPLGFMAMNMSDQMSHLKNLGEMASPQGVKSIFSGRQL